MRNYPGNEAQHQNPKQRFAETVPGALFYVFAFAMRTKPLNIQSLTWLSDIHLEFLRQRKIDDFAKQVQAHPGKAVLITGDMPPVVCSSQS